MFMSTEFVSIRHFNYECWHCVIKPVLSLANNKPRPISPGILIKQSGVMAKVTNIEVLPVGITDNDGVSGVDKSLRYSLGLLGVLSGSSLPSISLLVRRVSLCAHATLAVLFTVVTSYAGAIAWEHEEDEDFAVLMFKIVMLICFGCTTLDCVAFFYVGVNDTVLKFYKHLDKVSNQLAEQDVKLDIKKLKKIATATAVTAWVVVIVFTGIATSSLAQHQHMFPIFGESLIDRTSSNAEHYALKILGAGVLYLMYQAQIVYKMFYFAYTCWMLRHLLCVYNTHLKALIKTNPHHEIITKLRSLRMTHLGLLRLVGHAHDVFQYHLALSIVMFTVVTLMNIYLASVGFSGSHIAWVLVYLTAVYGVMLLTLIMLCEAVESKTTEARESLLLLTDETDHQLTNNQLNQMNLFMDQVRVATSLSAGGLITINKDFGLSIASTMLAYLFVLESLGASKIDDELASNSTEEEGHH